MIEDMIAALIILGTLSVLASGFIIAGIIAAKKPLPEYHGTERITSFFPPAAEDRSGGRELVSAT